MASNDRSHWQPDNEVSACNWCAGAFTITDRRHHCRQCGKIFCGDCSFYRSVFDNFVKPERICLDCILNFAYQQTGVSRLEPEEKLKCIEVKEDSSRSFHNVHIESAETPGVTGQANARFDLEECYVDWIKKDSNGTIILTKCFITGDAALEIGGNNTVELRKCIVLGACVAAHLTDNVKLEAWDTYFIATGIPKGLRATSIRLEGNSKAFLNRCTVIGSNGIYCAANSKLEVKSGLVVAQKSRVPAFPHYAAIHGKGDMNGTQIFGFVKERGSEPEPVTKVGRSAFKVLHRVPGVGHVTRVVI